jgi:hypothetical protein
MIESESVEAPCSEASAEWTVDLSYRPKDGTHFCAVQQELPWSESRSYFYFEEGNLVGWNMDKTRVEKIIAKINAVDPTTTPFLISTF